MLELETGSVAQGQWLSALPGRERRIEELDRECRVSEYDRLEQAVDDTSPPGD